MSDLLNQPHGGRLICGARTRSGGQCGHSSMANGRCRYHGGLSTGPKKPFIKHGRYTKATMAEARLINQLIKDANLTVSELID